MSARYFAHEPGKQSIDSLTSTLADAQVDLNPHHVEAALFVFRSPLSAMCTPLLEVGMLRVTSEDQQTFETACECLTGQRFCRRVEAIVDAFSTMQDGPEKVRRALTKQRGQRSEQLRRVVAATAGMYSDLQRHRRPIHQRNRRPRMEGSRQR